MSNHYCHGYYMHPNVVFNTVETSHSAYVHVVFESLLLCCLSLCMYSYIWYCKQAPLTVVSTHLFSLYNQISDMVDSPMYAVINNSIGSGSVAYECEGHETRLSDCMSPLSSTVAPCYYALVKCFSRGSTTSGSSAGIVAGVVASLLAVLLVVTIVIIIILVVWLKRRDKNFNAADVHVNNASTTSPQSPTSSAAVTGAMETKDVALALGNPTYSPTHFQTAQTNESPEHKFINPLYSTPSEAGVNNE